MQDPTPTPSPEQPRKKWDIPKSYGLGFNPGYFNILKGNPWITAYVRENFGWHDASSFVEKFYKKGEAYTQNCRPEERPRISHEYLRDMVLGLPISKSLAAQLVKQLTQIAGKNHGPMDLVRAKSFFAYCGIEGLYDLETGKHWQVQRRLLMPPYTLLRSRWLDADPEECEKYRMHITELMCFDEIKAFKEKLLAEYKAIRDPINDAMWPTVKARMESGEPPFPNPDIRFAWECETFPQFKDQMLKAERVHDVLEPYLEALKDKWAPMDPDFEYPEVGSAYDLDWQEEHDAMLRSPDPWKQRWTEHQTSLGFPKGHPEHKTFDINEMQHRCYSIQDYALRDFTMSPINRGSNVHFRNLDIPHDFIRAVKKELCDGMLEVLKPPHRIEKLKDGSDRWQFIVYGAEAGTFTLQDVADLEASLPPNDRTYRPSKWVPDSVLNSPLVVPARSGASAPAPSTSAFVAPQLDEGTRELMTNARAKLVMVNKNGLLEPEGYIKSQIQKRICDELFEFNKQVVAAGQTLLTAPELDHLTNIIEREHQRMAEIERAKEQTRLLMQGSEPVVSKIDKSEQADTAKNGDKPNAGRTQAEGAPAADASVNRSNQTSISATAGQPSKESSEDSVRRDRSKQAVREAVQTMSQVKAPRKGATYENRGQSEDAQHGRAFTSSPSGPGRPGKKGPTEEELRERLGQAQTAALSMGVSPPVIDFGISSLARSMIPGRSKRPAALQHVSEATPTRADIKADTRMDEIIARTHELRESTSRLDGTFEQNRTPLSAQARLAEWENMTDTLTKLGELTSDLRQSPAEHKEKLLEVLSESNEAAEKAAKLIDKYVDKPGAEGEAAREAKDAVERMIEMIKSFIDALLILLGLKKKPSKDRNEASPAPV